MQGSFLDELKIATLQVFQRMLEDEKLEYTDIDEYFGQLGIEPLNRVKLSNY